MHTIMRCAIICLAYGELATLAHTSSAIANMLRRPTGQIICAYGGAC